MGEEVAAGLPSGRGDSAAIPARRPRRSRERGAVTAEAAVVLPVLVAFALGLVWLLAVAVAQVRVVDGAREAARVAARGDSDAEAKAQARRVAGGGADVDVTRGEQRVAVTVRVDVDGPGGLFGALPGVTVESRAMAVEEPG